MFWRAARRCRHATVSIMAKRLVIKKAGVTGDWLFAHAEPNAAPCCCWRSSRPWPRALVAERPRLAGGQSRARPGGLAAVALSDGRGVRPADIADSVDATPNASVCPACRAAFAPEDTLFIARQPDLPPDHVLGPDTPAVSCPRASRRTARHRSGRRGPPPTPPARLPRRARARAAACRRGLAAASRPAATRMHRTPAAATRHAGRHIPAHGRPPRHPQPLVLDRLLGDVVARQYAELCRRATGPPRALPSASSPRACGARCTSRPPSRRRCSISARGCPSPTSTSGSKSARATAGPYPFPSTKPPWRRTRCCRETEPLNPCCAGCAARSTAAA